MRILHISDAHFGVSGDEYDERKVTASFVSLCEQRFGGAPPDLIAFTGDIGHAGRPSDYDRAERFLTDVLSTCGIGPDRLFLVPGNHDVDRSAGLMLRRTIDSAQEADDGFFARPSAREHHLRKFDAYVAMVQRLQPGIVIADGDAVAAPKVIEIDGRSIGIACFNSAWFAQDDHDSQNLWLGSRLIRERSQHLDAAGAEFRIALMHHPTSWLHEADPSSAWLQQQFDMVLRGHLHKALSERVATVSTSVLEVAAGALYQGSYQPCRAFVIDVDFTAGRVRLEPLTFVDAPSAETWVLDPSVFPGQASTGYVAEMLLSSPPGYDGRPSTSAAIPPLQPGSATWLPRLADWFSSEYLRDRDAAMGVVLDQTRELLLAAKAQQNFGQILVNLAVTLRGCLPSGPDPTVQQDRLVFDVLASDVVGPISHLFMVPEIDIDELFVSESYAELILSTRRLGAGEFAEAERNARAVGVGCCVAGFVIGQALRKQERTLEARAIFAFIKDNLDEGERAFPVCNAGPESRCLCAGDLLAGELERALAVVSRRLGRVAEAEKHFGRARELADQIIAVRNGQTGDQSLPGLQVAADVYFSEGYLYFEQGDYARAAPMFRRSMEAVTQARMMWDAPSTRYGLCALLTGSTGEAIDELLRARELCYRSLGTNREAALSASLCSLALHVAAELDGAVVAGDAIGELAIATGSSPAQGVGALKCHLSDASKLWEVAGRAGTLLVDEYVQNLEVELQAWSSEG